MSGPSSAKEWKDRLDVVHKYLGYKGDLLSRGVINVFMPVEALSTPVV